MALAAKKLKKPNETAPFKEYILYYMNRKGWNQSTLAQHARLSQSNVCKIINGNYERTKMESFVSLSLVLQLTVKEVKTSYPERSVLFLLHLSCTNSTRT